MRLSLLLLAASLAACGSVSPGTGRKPVALEIRMADGTTGSYQTYECGGVQLYAILQSDGDGGLSEDDASGRVDWSSSNPGVIDVAGGLVIAHTAGSALIRAEFLGFTSQFAVAASAMGDLRITPDLTRITPGSSQQFALELVLSGSSKVQDISDLAE